MIDWDELIDEVVCEAKNWFYDDAPLNEAVSALRAAIAELEQERDNLKTVLHGNQDADYDKQLQIETLKSQLAEAEADAEHLADAITWLDEKTDPCKLALELHRARKEGK